MNRKRKVAVVLALTGLLVVASCGGDEPEGVEAVLEVRYFDSRDLGHPRIEPFSGDSRRGPYSPPPQPGQSDAEVAAFEAALLALVTEDCGGDAAWREPAVIEVRNGIVIARNTSSILDRLGVLLDEVRAEGGLRTYLKERR